MGTAKRIRTTPLVASAALSEILGAPVFLKLESLQNTGSFKLRGASLALSRMAPEQLREGVVTASAGNHGAGLAMAAEQRKVPVRIYVPERTPENKLARMRSLGAQVLVQGADYDASESLARIDAEQSGARFVSAYDDEDVIAGNGGTLALELVAQAQELGFALGTVVVPVGGGGLIAGVSNELCPRGISVVGVQPENNCAMADSIDLGRALCEYSKDTTIAEGCEGAVCERTYAAVRKNRVGVLRVSETSIADAVAFLYERCGVIAETSAAVVVAALLSGLLPKAATTLVISGGNIDASYLDTLLAEVRARRNPKP